MRLLLAGLHPIKRTPMQKPVVDGLPMEMQNFVLRAFNKAASSKARSRASPMPTQHAIRAAEKVHSCDRHEDLGAKRRRLWTKTTVPGIVESTSVVVQSAPSRIDCFRERIRAKESAAKRQRVQSSLA